MGAAAIEALGTVFALDTLPYIVLGTFVGLFVGLLPGLGGVSGMAILIPFIYGMEPHAAIAMLVGMGAVTNTSDTLVSVMLGVPGSTGAAATILDGHPMARNGQAGRALGAAYFASLMGGLFGAVILFLFLPVARPVILSFGSPELFMFVLFGLSMVGTLVSGSALAGLTGALLGMLLSTMGGAPATAELRYTFGILYLLNGIPLVIFALGLYAVPELIDLLRRGKPIAGDTKIEQLKGGVWEGVKDNFRHPLPLLGGSAIGVWAGVMPGLGGSVASWVSYGMTARFVRRDPKFGQGDVRGVIAPEAANNSNDGGELIPTLLFGIPGSASMAVMLGALVVIGVQPGPNLLRDANLPIILVVIWSLVLANVIATTVMMMVGTQAMKVSLVPPRLLVPFILVIIFAAAYQNTRHWGDIIAVVVIGVIAWLLKQARWPRPPILVGYVLGTAAERYLGISYGRFALEWLTRPLVMTIGALTLGVIIYGTIRSKEGEANTEEAVKEMVLGDQESEIGTDDATR